ncbi:MAG: hypothetical protein LBQ64_00850 [Bacteroidales bacterium]|jgi:asparagine synthase (glutamine-hydrolysing)|nr:hypothetical protein [Bacteroidales bacterium]
MNGLVALVNETNAPPACILKTAVDDALATLAHRGTKEQRTFFFNKEGLFSAYDPAMPAVLTAVTCFHEGEDHHYLAKSDNVVMLFAGKLFNRSQLTEKIVHRNVGCISNSDAETALCLYLEEGTNAFASFDGYWSLIVVDANKQKLYAAADHFGNRTLFYCQTDTHFGIASESNTLFSTLKESGKINVNAVADFLSGRDVTSCKQSFFSDIHALTPSHYLEYSITDHSLTEKPYYTLPYKNCKGGYNEYEESFYIDTVRQLVLESVGNNIKGNTEIAVGIDGDINSAALLYCARKINPDVKITAFTSGYLHSEESLARIEQMTTQTGTEWVNISFSPRQLIEQLGMLIQKQHLPVFSMDAFVRYKMMEKAQQHGMNAMIGDQGGDELFGGYARYFAPFFRFLRSQWMFKDWIRECLMARNTALHCKERECNCLQFFNRDYSAIGTHSISGQAKQVLNDWLFESYTLSLPTILRLEEQTAACFGMDSLSPFSNSVKLAEAVFAMPSTFKIHNGWNKYLLRSAMVGIVPNEIQWKKSLPNTHLAQEWWYAMNTDLKKQIQLLDDTERIINKDLVMKLWDKLYSSDNHSFQQFTFRYYSYLLWVNGLKDSFVQV